MPNTVLKQIIEQLPDGYSMVSYNENRYGMTVQRFNNSKSVKIFARELKGTDFISLNFYTSSSQDHLKPCEMSQEKVIRFLLNHQPINRKSRVINMNEDVRFENKRFNPEITPFLSLAKEMAKAFGYTADLSVNKELAQLLRLRVSQYNECAYCVILHAATARDIGIHSSKVDNISSWWQSDLYTDSEKVALEYTDSLTHGKDPGFQQKHEQMTTHYSEVEIAEIAAIVINMNVWTRLKLAQGETPVFN